MVGHANAKCCRDGSFFELRFELRHRTDPKSLEYRGDLLAVQGGIIVRRCLFRWNCTQIHLQLSKRTAEDNLAKRRRDALADPGKARYVGA